MEDNRNESGIFKPGHYWGKAKSDNPKDPVIRYDTMKDKFSIDYTACNPNCSLLGN